MSRRTSPDPQTIGVIYVFIAYLLWGIFPLYFVALAPTSAWEVVGWRVLFSLAVCVVLLTATRTWSAVAAIVRQPRLLLWTAVAGVLIYINWQIFVIAALSERIIETSLGYFITPIITVLLGVLVLRERMRPTQWVAIALAAVAVTVIVVGYGAFPWVALTLAFSFGLYGLVKKRTGGSVDAVSGLAMETAWLTPVALVQILVVGGTIGITFGTAGLWHAILLSLSGLVTAIPLLLFAGGARRIPLSAIGFLQFLAPIMQFIVGAWIMGEPMPPERWVGFALVWVALAILMADLVATTRRTRRAGRARNASSDPQTTWAADTALPK